MIERILTDIRSHVQDLTDASDITLESYRTEKRTRRFVERTLHILIEACIDVAQHIITDEKLREPESYRDTFAILAENGILRPGDLESFENMASFRNLLVHYYESVDDEIVYGIFKQNLSDFDLFVVVYNLLCKF
ncbi:MAG: DUF86 domain-containing protein [Deltaproteobacteria bacterium]|nr:DUF86 domain-containing protein [Deltaproteobacteria bacterium]